MAGALPRLASAVARQTRIGVVLLGLLAPAVAVGGDARVDVNTASVAELAALPGLGPDRAAAVVRWREQQGAFRTVDDLVAVPGIGKATVAAIRDRVRAGDAPATRPAPALAAGRMSLTPAASTARPPVAPRAAATPPVDVNRAGADKLVALPGVDGTLAARIVADRDRNGPYRTCRDLVRVDGIGPATVAHMGTSCVARPR